MANRIRHDVFFKIAHSGAAYLITYKEAIKLLEENLRSGEGLKKQQLAYEESRNKMEMAQLAIKND